MKQKRITLFVRESFQRIIQSLACEVTLYNLLRRLALIRAQVWICIRFLSVPLVAPDVVNETVMSDTKEIG